MQIDISKFGKGGLVKAVDRKDYRLEALGATGTLPKSFEIDYKGKIKNQNGSGSCVSQAVSYYAEYLNFQETQEWTEFSARDLYSKVYQDPIGSYIKDNMKIMANDGIVLETDAPSYENGNAPSEAFMRKRDDITAEEEKTAKNYMIKKYVTWDNTNIDMFKKAIVTGNGCVTVSWGNDYCWGGSNIMIPDNRSQMSWRHGIYFTGFNDDTKKIKFINSWGDQWGDGGFGYLPYDYVVLGYLSNPMTMIDVPNDTYIKMSSQIINLQEMIRLQTIINALKVAIAKLLIKK